LARGITAKKRGKAKGLKQGLGVNMAGRLMDVFLNDFL